MDLKMDLKREIIGNEVVETYTPDCDYISEVTYRYPVKTTQKTTMTDVYKKIVVDYLKTVKKIDL
jgi:hypothetical protein